LQWEVIKELTIEFFVGESSKNQARSIFVVGDEKQSIFGFQGSDFKLFYQMKEYFANIAQQANRIFYNVSLEKSYRSSQAILTLVDRIYNNNLYKKLVSDNLADINHICTKASLGIIELEPIITHKDISEEEYLVEFVHNLKDLITNQGNEDILMPSDIMILFQKRDKRYYQLINECAKQDISFYVESYSNIFDQLLIKDLIAFAQFAVMPNDDYNLASLLKSPMFLLDDTTLYNIKFGLEKPLWEIIKESSDYNQIVAILNQIISFNTSGIYDFFAQIIFEINPIYQLIQQNNQFYIVEEFLELVKDFEQLDLSAAIFSIFRKY
jgi:ATP-dependent helicase/nuclease subunit A